VSTWTRAKYDGSARGANTPSKVTSRATSTEPRVVADSEARPLVVRQHAVAEHVQVEIGFVVGCPFGVRAADGRREAPGRASAKDGQKVRRGIGCLWVQHRVER
jgi:hypothetical protein